MRTRKAIVVFFATLAALAIVVPAASAQSNCTSLNGTITGQFLLELPAPLTGRGWYGQAYFTFGKDPTVYNGTVLDQSAGKKDHPSLTDPSGNFAGDERLTFTFEDGSAFVVEGQFIGVAGSGPYAYHFNETGKVTSGTGVFADASGNLSIHGSFVVAGGFPPKGDPAHPWVWIAEITGTICARR